jgi:hemerythrin
LRSLQWTTGLEIGIPEIDDDHRRLIQDCNQIGAAISASPTDLDVLAIARQMQEDCSSHFRREGRILLAAAHPDLDQHVREHYRIELALPMIIEDLRMATPAAPAAQEVLSFLRSTLIDHFVYFGMLFNRICFGTGVTNPYRL